MDWSFNQKFEPDEEDVLGEVGRLKIFKGGKHNWRDLKAGLAENQENLGKAAYKLYEEHMELLVEVMLAVEAGALDSSCPGEEKAQMLKDLVVLGVHYAQTLFLTERVKEAEEGQGPGKRF